MGILDQSFVTEVVSKAEFLTRHGFTGPEVGVPPAPATGVAVSYRFPPMRMEWALTAGEDGREQVVLTGYVADADGGETRREIARQAVRDEREMRRAVSALARNVQRTMPKL